MAKGDTPDGSAYEKLPKISCLAIPVYGIETSELIFAGKIGDH
jgi:hypothetical protein